jgi:hypothetical protein
VAAAADSTAENGLVFFDIDRTWEVSALKLKGLTIQDALPVTPHARLGSTGSSTLEQHCQYSNNYNQFHLDRNHSHGFHDVA